MEPRSVEKPKLWTRNFILITIATFFIFSGFQILLPTLPKYAAQLGAEKSIIGLINGIFTITAVFFRPFIGRELDRRGRKSIYLVGIGVFFLAVLGYIWVPTLFLLLSVRLIHGIGWAGASTASGTMVADIIPATRRGEGMGYYGLASTLSMAIAPALGLTLLANYDFKIVFIVSLVFTAGAFVTGYAIKLEQNQGKVVDQKHVEKAPLFDKRAFKVALVMFCMTFSYGGVVTFLPLYGEELGILNMGLFFTVYALALMVTRPLAGKYFDKRGPDLIIIAGMLAIFISNVLLAQATTMEMFLICGVLFGLGFGSVHPTLMALAMKSIEPQRRGAINATVFSAFDLGIGLGALGLGIIANGLGYANMYLISAIAPIIGIVFFLGKIKGK